MNKVNYLNLFGFTSGVTPGAPNANPVNITTQASLSPTMKEFYDTTLLENAKAEMVFTQFGKKQAMKGNKIEWRKFNTFAKAMTPLTEGVTPTGQTFGMTKIEGETSQHGDYTAVSDRLEMESYDDVIFGATEEMGVAEGETYDTLTRNKIISGTNVYYCPDGNNAIKSRKDINANCTLTPVIANKVATQLKKNKTPKIDGYYVALIHPSVSLDFKESDDYKEYHKYNAVDPIFKGEIGEMHGVRFIESNNCKIHAPAVISDNLSRLTVSTGISAASTSVIVDEDLTAVTPDAPINIYINSVPNTITAIAKNTAGGSKITLGTSVSSIPAGAMVCGTGAGKDGSCVYDTLFLGKNAFGVLDPEGEGMEMIVKPKGVIGGALEQFSTIGYKFCHGAEILYPERLVRVESGSKYFGMTDEEN